MPDEVARNRGALENKLRPEVFLSAPFAFLLKNSRKFSLFPVPLQPVYSIQLLITAPIVFLILRRMGSKPQH